MIKNKNEVLKQTFFCGKSSLLANSTGKNPSLYKKFHLGPFFIYRIFPPQNNYLKENLLI